MNKNQLSQAVGKDFLPLLIFTIPRQYLSMTFKVHVFVDLVVLNYYVKAIYSIINKPLTSRKFTNNLKKRKAGKKARNLKNMESKKYGSLLQDA